MDVVALSLPGQYVAASAAEDPQRFGRIVLISPTGFRRFKGSAGRISRNIYRFLRLTGIGRLLFEVLARRKVIRWFLRQIFVDPEQVPREYERYCWRTCQQPGAFRAPLAFVSGLLDDPRAEGAYKRLANPTLLVFGDHPRFTDPAAAEALVTANGHLERITIAHAGRFSHNSSSRTRPRPWSTSSWLSSRAEAHDQRPAPHCHQAGEAARAMGIEPPLGLALGRARTPCETALESHLDPGRLAAPNSCRSSTAGGPSAVRAMYRQTGLSPVFARSGHGW